MIGLEDIVQAPIWLTHLRPHQKAVRTAQFALWIRWRVFEEKSAVDILKTCLSCFLNSGIATEDGLFNPPETVVGLRWLSLLTWCLP